MSTAVLVLKYGYWGHTAIAFTKYTSNLQLYRFEIIGFDKFRPKLGRRKHFLPKIAIIFKSVQNFKHSPVHTCAVQLY